MKRKLRTASDAEPVVLVAYDARWPNAFEKEKQCLQAALDAFGLTAIEHIGSTAIVGMTAKPIVDIMVGVEDMHRLPATGDALWGSLGYQRGGDEDQPQDWMHLIKRDASGERIAHLHIVPFASEFWNRHIAFRDALREDVELAEQYRVLKERLASRHRRERLRYGDGKTSFITSVVDRRLRG